MFPYESLEVYKKAFAINKTIYGFLKAQNQLQPYIKNQLGRASLSIMLNIAEGSAKLAIRIEEIFLLSQEDRHLNALPLLDFFLQRMRSQNN